MTVCLIGDYEKDQYTYLQKSIVNVMQSPFNAKGDGIADDTIAIQSAIDALKNTNGTLILPSGQTFNVTQLIFHGYLYIQGNNSYFKSIATSNSKPIIQADSSKGNCFLTIRDLNFKGDNVAIDMQFANGSGPGIKLIADNCRFSGTNRTANAINLRQTDFLCLINSSFSFYNTCLNIQSNTGVGERSNTQMHVENVCITYSNLGCYLRQIDISSFLGMDVASCATGFYLYKDVTNTVFTNCHAETFGQSGYNAYNYNSVLINGYGFYIEDNMPNSNLTFNNCTAFPIGNIGAVAGFYQGNSNGIVNCSKITFNDCQFIFDSTVPNYQSLILKAFATWNGRFTYTSGQVTLNASSSTIVDIIINQNGVSDTTSKNLLPFSRVSSPEQLSLIEGTGTFAIAADSDALEYDGRILQFSGISGLFRPQCVVNLKTGWHTLVFNGYNKSLAPQLFVGMQNSPWTNILVATIYSVEIKTRHVFYISTAGAYKIGFQVGGDCSLVCSRIELHKGFVNEFMDNDPTVCKMSALATAGAWNLGDRIINSIPAVGQPKAWICTVSGTPGTWVSEGNL